MPRPGSAPISPSFSSSRVFGVGGLMDRTVTIEEQTAGRDSWGEPTDMWAPVDGLVDLAAAVGRSSNGAEQRRATGTISVSTHSIVLAGYYPQITTAHRAVVDGAEVHDIESVEHDSRLHVTQLQTRIVS